VELLRANPQIQITCVEQCEGMIQQARQRLAREKLDGSRVSFQQMDVLVWTPPPGKFDLVVTNFFLDCFRSEQLQKLIPRLAGSATKDAIWLLAGTRLAALARKSDTVHALCFFQTHHCVVRNLAYAARQSSGEFRF
jgi:chemotaxis methyl-accepting protein methylase